MTNSYTKNCNFCGQQIRMAKMENGQWLPFEIDGSGKHQCNTAPISRTAANKTYSLVKQSNEEDLEIIRPVQIKETFQHDDFESSDNSSCLVPIMLMFLFLIIIFIWYFMS